MAKKHYGKHTRREVLITGLRTGTSAGVYSLIGNLLGKGYREGRDAYRKIEPALEALGKISPMNYLKEQKPSENEYTRRGFFSEVLKGLGRVANEYPVAAGTSAGIAYGTGKGIWNARDRLEKAGMKDRIKSLEEKIRNLEGKGNSSDTLLALGISGIALSAFSAAFSLTGYSIYQDSSGIIKASAMILIMSVALALAGLFSKRKK
jgi:hypothetical protein